MNQQQTSESVNGKSATSSVIEQDVRSNPETDEIADRHQAESVFIPEKANKFPVKNAIYTVIAVILLVAGGGAAWRWWQSNQAAAPPQAGQAQPMPVPVKLATIETSTLQDTSDFVGSLESRRSVQLRSEAEGRISQIYVKAGDFVKQGEIIARIDSAQVQAAIQQERANILRAQARLQELKAGSRPEEIARAQASVAEAQARLADARAGSRRDEIAAAQARVEAAQADAALKQQRLRRYEELRKVGGISQNALDQYVAENRSAEANVREAKASLERLNQSRRSDVTELTAALEQQTQALRLLQSGTRSEEIAQAEAQVAQAQAQLRTQEVLLRDTGVSAPFSGAIGDVPAKVGDYLRKGDIITTLTQNQSLELRLAIPVERQPQLRLGLPVQLEGTQNSLTGEISFISPKVNPDSQSILAKATFDNSPGQLRDGQFVRAKVVWNSYPNTIVIPTTAVIFQGQDRFVYVAEKLPTSPPPAAGQPVPQPPTAPNPQAAQAPKAPPPPTMKAKLQKVELGLVKGDQTQIVNGLEAGSQIVISGTQKLADGAPIMPMP